MEAFRTRWRSLALTTGALGLIALGVATRPEHASAFSCKTRSTRIRLVSVTEDGAPGNTANYEGLVLLFGREAGTVQISARPQSSNLAAAWIESYRVAAAASP